MTRSLAEGWESEHGVGEHGVGDHGVGEHGVGEQGSVGPRSREPLAAAGFPPRRSVAPAEVAIVAGLLMAGVAAPVAAALVTHSFSIPRNDDWAYRRVLFDFVRTGHYSLVGWGAMTLVGQILWAAPFVVVLGAQPWVPGVTVVLTAVIALSAVYVVARRMLGRAPAAAVVATVLALPGFLINTSSFMTDVPAFAAGAACLALGAVALARVPTRRWAWTTASLAAGVFGFSVRQFDLAAPMAVLVVLAARDHPRLKRYCFIGVCVLAACGAIYAWSASLPGAQHKPLGWPTPATWDVLGGCYFTLSFLVTPWLPGALGRSPSRFGWRALVAGAVALAIGLVLTADHQPLLVGNYLSQSGAMAGQVLYGVRPELFPQPIWRLMEVVALASGTGLAVVIAGRPPRRQGRQPAGPPSPVLSLVRMFTLLNALGLIGYGVFVKAAVWDRYLWPVAFGTALLLAAHRPDRRPARLAAHRPGWLAAHRPGWLAAHRPGWLAAHRPGWLAAHRPGWLAGRRPAPVTPLATRSLRRASSWAWPAATAALALGLATVTAALTLNSGSYDGARWSAGQDAVNAGYAAATVDAGFEWVGDHAAAVAEPGRSVAHVPGFDTWYDQMFPAFTECAFVSGSPVNGSSLVLLRTVRYNEVAFAVPEQLYVYAVRSSEVPAHQAPR